MNILEINPVDFGGGLGHVAAGQLYEFILGGDGTPGPTWYGGSSAQAEDLQKDVLFFAGYVNGRKIAGEQLWRRAQIEGIVEDGLTSFEALPLARRMAFDMFTTICAIAHERLELAQLDISRQIPHGDDTPAPGLKIEDSIFEPHGSLGDMEPHQKQFLEDQKKLDEQRLEDQASAETADQEPAAFTAGAPIGDQVEPDRPESITVGAKVEKETADQGQAADGEAPADPGAQGDVSGLADDDGDEPGSGEGVGEAGDPASPPAQTDEVGASMAGGGVAADSGGDPAAEPVTKTPAKAPKSKKVKSTT